MARIVRRATVAPRYAGRAPQAAAASRGRADSPTAIGRDLRAAISDMLKNVMLTAADAVEAACPIQTGHLISNFILSVGRPYSGVTGSPESVSYTAQDAGRVAVLNYDVGRDGRIYYTNFVDYLKNQRPFVTEALMGAVAAAPRGQKTRARAALKAIARTSFKRGA